MREVDKQIADLISAANEVTIETNPSDPARTKLFGMALDLCKAGTQTRLRAIQEAYRITDLDTCMGVVADLIAGMPGMADRLDSEAMTVLATSRREELWYCLCQLAHIFARHVPRQELKQALVTAWKEAEGAAKDNIEHTLRRQGFSKLYSLWI